MFFTATYLLAVPRAFTPEATGEIQSECFICMDKNKQSKICQLNCANEHFICLGCLTFLFEHALESDINYPAHCCEESTELRVDDYKDNLPRSLVQRYRKKADEYETALAFRRYCANSACHNFLSTEEYEYTSHGTIFQCASCGIRTCIKCMQVQGPDGGHQLSEQCEPFMTSHPPTVYGAGFRVKNCPYCMKAIELIEGCNHVTCLCRNEWCFMCQQPWTGFHHCLIEGEQADDYYDEKGFAQDGFHRYSHLDRQGYNRRGVNVEGKNREGTVIHGFAKQTSPRTLAEQLRALVEVPDEEVEHAAIMTLIEEVEAGTIYANDADELLDRHFPNIRINGADHHFEEWDWDMVSVQQSDEEMEAGFLEDHAWWFDVETAEECLDNVWDGPDSREYRISGSW